jgi:hypothetical protein
MTRPARPLRSIVAVALACMCAAVGRADLPGTIELAASGGRHVWWVVANDVAEPAPVDAAADAAREPAWLLMHHAVEEPAPTERLVMRLPQKPEAIAAEGDELVVVLPPAGAREHVVLSLRARRNAAVGHWYSEPRSGPEYLAPLEGSGSVAGLAMVDGAIYALLRPREAERPRSATVFRVLPAEGTGPRVWRDLPLPPLSRAADILLARSGSELVAFGEASDAPALFVLEGDAWRREALARADAESLAQERARARGVRAEPRADAREPIGLIEVGGRLAIVERVRAGDESPRIETALRRQGRLIPWASFGEPAAPWALGGFGDAAVLLTLDERRRASAAGLSPADAEPAEPVALSPPGFAAHAWVHLPIIGALSIALVLAAVVLGSDAFLAARAPQGDAGDGGGGEPSAPPARRSRPVGAPLGQRALAMAIDIAPGVLVAWLVYGGNPLLLVQFPSFVADLPAAEGAMVALGIGWALATLGDLFFGRSLGKRVLGLVIVDVRPGSDGDLAFRPATRWQRLVRGLASLVVLASPLVMLLAYLHPSGDGPAEMLSGSAVVDAGAIEPLAAGSDGSGSPDGGPG